MSQKPFESFTLPNGTILKNRIAKSALQERLADVPNHGQPSNALLRLYKAWGDGGAGLILSGHIMIDPWAMSSPGDVLLAEDGGHFDEKLWRKWISTTQENGAQFWFQINQPGRQIPKGSGLPTYAPSAISMKMGPFSGLFAVPEEMNENQIQEVVRRFVWTARKAEELGASGVQIHAAHGYLMSQFLSPNTNKRTDQWGGPLENRARLLFQVLREVRAAVSSRFGVGVKINTADFQRGGFSSEDFIEVVKKLSEMDLDLLEVSGGNYESPVMTTGTAGSNATSTAQREAYFLVAAESIKNIGTMPIMVTGGIRKRSTLDSVIESSDRFIAGVGTAIGMVPDLPNRWARGEDPAPTAAKSWVLHGKALAAARILTVQFNMHRTGRGSKPWVEVWPLLALLTNFLIEIPQMKAYKRWIRHHAKEA